MKVFVGTKTGNGHVHVEGPFNVSAHGGRWFVWIAQSGTDPIVAVRHGNTPNFETMQAEQAVTPAPTEGSAFIGPFRAILTMAGNRIILEVTDGARL